MKGCIGPLFPELVYHGPSRLLVLVFFREELTRGRCHDLFELRCIVDCNNAFPVGQFLNSKGRRLALLILLLFVFDSLSAEASDLDPLVVQRPLLLLKMAYLARHIAWYLLLLSLFACSSQSLVGW